MKKKRYIIALMLALFFVFTSMFSIDAVTFLKYGKIQSAAANAYSYSESGKTVVAFGKVSGGFKSGSFKSSAPSSGGFKSGNFKSTIPKSGSSTYKSGGFFGGGSSGSSTSKSGGFFGWGSSGHSYPNWGKNYSSFNWFNFRGLGNILSAYVFFRAFARVIIIIVVVMIIISIFKRRRY